MKQTVLEKQDQILKGIKDQVPHLNPFLYGTDSYKVSHITFETEGVKEIYSNFTPRFSKYMESMLGKEYDNKYVVFGIQWMLLRLHTMAEEGFFKRPKEEVISEMKKVHSPYIGNEQFSHFEALHDLGYLPIIIKTLDEGTVVPVGVPFLTIRNSLPEFEWLPNYLETILSTELWKSITVATVARTFRLVGNKFALETTGSIEGVEWQNHDFHVRGASGLESAAISGVAFLTSSCGTDNIPALWAAYKFYQSSNEQGLLAGSVSAGEHSVTTSGILTEQERAAFDGEVIDLLEAEKRYLKTLLTEKFTTGIFSYVADSFDYYGMLEYVLPQLKSEILSRDGKFVIRGDSGNPVDVICGDVLGITEVEVKGTIEHLWDTFGGTINEQGYKVLDSHIGMIYGDGITVERQVEILTKLKVKGFASTNITFGAGSYSLNYLSRDHLGMAIKATNTIVEIGGKLVDKPIYKEPKTDTSKKSLRGLISVHEDEQGNLYYKDMQTRKQEDTGLLGVVYMNGQFHKFTDVFTIRDKIWK